MGAAIFVSKLSLKIVRFNVALRHTAEAWWGTNRPRLAEWAFNQTLGCFRKLRRARRSFMETAAWQDNSSDTLYIVESARAGKRTRNVESVRAELWNGTRLNKDQLIAEKLRMRSDVNELMTSRLVDLEIVELEILQSRITHRFRFFNQTVSWRLKVSYEVLYTFISLCRVVFQLLLSLRPTSILKPCGFM